MKTYTLRSFLQNVSPIPGQYFSLPNIILFEIFTIILLQVHIEKCLHLGRCQGLCKRENRHFRRRNGEKDWLAEFKGPKFKNNERTIWLQVKTFFLFSTEWTFLSVFEVSKAAKNEGQQYGLFLSKNALNFEHHFRSQFTKNDLKIYDRKFVFLSRICTSHLLVNQINLRRKSSPYLKR